MGRKVRKTLSIDLKLVERLESESDQSEVVERALAEYWGVEVE
ncbi:hypothetical protein [Halogeometricum luteum]|jgi:hypothetical protein|nr:hypothetical protein [Halogeometricum sp. S3BR5-2]